MDLSRIAEIAEISGTITIVGGFVFGLAHPAFAEWFEWLAVLCQRYTADAAPPYERGADWRP